MMAESTSKFPAWTIIYVLFFILRFISDAAGQCTDGIYQHEGRDCCQCGVGLKLVQHCVSNLQHGTCESCDTGRFRSEASSEKTCERCRSCTHPNENLEVDEPCTPSRNTKCRCQQDHYCVSSTDICHLCHPCKKCGAEGIKVQCAGNNNTVCNEEKEDGNHAGMIVGIIAAIILIALALVAVFIYKRRRSGQQNKHQVNGHEMQPFQFADVELQPLIPDIAIAIGWKDMKVVAMKSGMQKTRIDNCEQNNQGDREEQTLQLLQIWREGEGRKAPEKLIRLLQQSGKEAKAEKVAEILRHAASNQV
ncbi:tumor necrosis factor receptor superfamily member 6 [Notolabrus celidotus]|uniref:tumor necrosis factor receptor superfamily member 6 n=1 Tax=Notolabrus celidotus TaxID=1203425 RepID=UPI0014903A2E|nr:tumor necrosis factor receptor superfamily member 6 [Notolabrus celidotus]